MFRPVDYLLDRITMYRLVLYFLIVLVGASAGLSALGYMQYNPLAIIASAVYLAAVCWLSNQLFARVFETPANVESSHITALILALIITPLANTHNLLFLTAAGGLAMASKYILAIRKKHIFNPAAIAVVLTSFGAHQAASWWVGTKPMVPFLLIGGFLVVRKIQRPDMVVSFFASALFFVGLLAFLNHGDVSTSLQKTVLSSSLLFLGFIMLTEPLTSPPTRDKRIFYGIITGLLFLPQLHVGGIYSTPELALVIGNLYAYFASPKFKVIPQLLRKNAIGPDVGDFVFATSRKINYKPGQYMEWTLGHEGTDSRGNRRYFTLASSPTEDTLRLGVKFYPGGSSFKDAMKRMDNRTFVSAGSLSGDFTLPDDTSEKLAFIAGGIGITPYRSMVKYLLDMNEPRDVTLLYSERKPESVAYRDVFDTAVRELGMKVVYTLTERGSVPASWTGQRGFVTADMISQQIPDYMERTFYVSGPHAMVTGTRDNLRKLGVARHRIKTDFFPGYA